jgi:hypothetical protein
MCNSNHFMNFNYTNNIARKPARGKEKLNHRCRLHKEPILVIIEKEETFMVTLSMSRIYLKILYDYDRFGNRNFV